MSGIYPRISRLCLCYNVLIPWLHNGGRYITFFMLVGDISRRQANHEIPVKYPIYFIFATIHFLPERHSAMVLIYICMLVCLPLSMGNPYIKFVCQNAWAELRGPNTRMLKVSFGSLKQSADYNFCSLSLPSSGRLKLTCDTHYSFLLKC